MTALQFFSTYFSSSSEPEKEKNEYTLNILFIQGIFRESKDNFANILSTLNSPTS